MAGTRRPLRRLLHESRKAMTGPGQRGGPWRVENASDSGFILEAELTGLADAFGLSNWKDGAAGSASHVRLVGW